MRVLVNENNYLKLRDRLISISKGEFSSNEILVNVWISKIDPPIARGIISTAKPPVIVDFDPIIEKPERRKMEDEFEPESRKDSLWGDLKLVTKKISRTVENEYEHYQNVQANTFKAPVNISLECHNVESLKVGERYTFKIRELTQSIILMVATRNTIYVDVELYNNLNGEEKSLEHFLKVRSVKHFGMLAVILMVIWIYSRSIK